MAPRQAAEAQLRALWPGEAAGGVQGTQASEPELSAFSSHLCFDLGK